MSPIDYVVPMVFHDDPLWQADYRSTGYRYDEHDLMEFVRYRSWGTEELLIRCVRRFMPFVRNVFVLLSRESQRRPWMDLYGIRVVYHREFIPERFLPTFNSCAIEMFLHRIPGLSERFLYGNDDMFPLVPLTEMDFFEGSVPCLHHTERPYPKAPNTFHMICRNGQAFAGKEFGRSFDGVLLRGGHSITPMLKSTWEYLWKRSDEIEASITPFRSRENLTQWVCPWWHYAAGNYVDRVPRKVYVSTRDGVDSVKAALSAENPGIVCVNDNECEADYMKYGRAVRECIGKILGGNTDGTA